VKLAIVGTGLIGGSMALALKNANFTDHVIGVDNNPAHLEKALESGVIDNKATLSEACREADLIALCVPVDAICHLLPVILDELREGAVVLDMGSTKVNICKSVAGHPKRSAFVATHPMAGTENSGPEAAITDLFKNKTSIICEAETSSKTALKLVESMFTVLQMKVEKMDPQTHDLHIAYVSHLSHISSFTLALTVLDKEKAEKSILKMAGGGFASTVRLAKSSPEMWAPIFKENAEHVSAALGQYIEKLQDFKIAIDAGDDLSTRKMMQKANGIKNILKP
jgi:prephenate dehydrogenase